MIRDFQTFIKQLEISNELIHIKANVDPYLEAGAIANKTAKQPNGGHALIFDNIKGASMPVAMNVFGSLKRIAMALNTEDGLIGLNSIADRINKIIKEILPQPESGFLDKFNKLTMLSDFGKWMPKSVKNGICQEVILRNKDAKLSKLPILTTWPGDSGPFITLGLSHTRRIDGQINMGLYRLQVHDDYTLGFHAHLHHDGYDVCRQNNQSNIKDNEKLIPIAISLGGDPILTYAATAPLPKFLSEIIFAGFLRKNSINMVRCITNDLEVPADSEIVIEGWLDPNDLRLEGPFGDHTGYYSLPDYYPVIHIEAITHRKNPVFPATIVGPPPGEDAYFALATERIFLPFLKIILPEIIDIHLPSTGCFHNLIIVSILKQFPGHAQKVMNAIWGTGQLMFTKTIVIVDHDVDPNNADEVLFHITGNVDPKRDMLFTSGPLDVLDHSSDRFAFGSKVGIDATRKNAKIDGFLRQWPSDLIFPDEILEKITSRWKEYGLPPCKDK